MSKMADLHMELTRRVPEKQEEIYDERVNDYNGWFLESFSESEELKKLSETLINGTYEDVGEIVAKMVFDYCYPSEKEAEEELYREQM